MERPTKSKTVTIVTYNVSEQPKTPPAKHRNLSSPPPAPKFNRSVKKICHNILPIKLQYNDCI
jgi:hypothetical protein